MAGWNSRGERECRERLEAQKAIFYKSTQSVAHPCLRIQDRNLEMAQENIRKHAWAKALYDGMVVLADHYADRTGAWIDTMVPELTPLHVYGTFCPVCEGDNTWGMIWDYKDPEKLVCCHCGAVMTDARFPEEGRLELPRSGQVLTYYLRPEEKGDPAFATGRHAFFWAGRPVHTSFTSAIRQKKTHHMPGVARTLAILYRMTGQDRYARAAAAILKRFAAVYPSYVFHDYWNTFMDCDPLYACELMARDEGIAKYEVNACSEQRARSGMKSGRYIQTFWGCGRMSCGGVQAEAGMLILLAEALDLLWDAKDGEGKTFLTGQEREMVVRDLLVEGLFTFTHWEGINNKVAGCRVGEVALGRFLGRPEYVHRGVAGFEPYLKGFFNFDGSTNEGSGYYLYAIHNVWGLPEAAQGYSDPKSYKKKDCFDNLSLYDPEGTYHTVLRGRVLMTLPDGRVPHTADAHEGPAGWPGPAWIHNLGLVRLGDEFAPFVQMDSGDEFALFNRPARLKAATPPPVRDRFFPGWLLAIFNAGYREMFQKDLTGTATFLMNFYEPNGHDHPDALNIAMFAEGVEVLSDLGYIGDHPLNASIRSTLKHNLVVIDEKEQLPRGKRPPGHVRLIATSPNVKVIAADCRAYEEAEVYRRLCVMIHRGAGPAYLVDCFGARGGKVHDYAIHGEGILSLVPTKADGLAIALNRRTGVMGGDIEKLRAGRTDGPWAAGWTDAGMAMRVQFVSPTEEVIVGDGPGQRDHSEIGARHNYLFARKKDRGAGTCFVTVIDPYRTAPDITGVEALVLPEGANDPFAVKVSRTGGEDVILSGQIETGDWALDGQAAVYSREGDGRQALFLASGAQFSSPGLAVSLTRSEQEGRIVEGHRDGFTAGGSIADGPAQAGCFVEVEDPDQGCRTAYAIQSVKGRKVRVDEFPFNAGVSFRIPSVFWMEERERDTFVVRTNVSAQVRIRTAKETIIWMGRGAAPVSRDGDWLVVEIDPRVLKSSEAVLTLA